MARINITAQDLESVISETLQDSDAEFCAFIKELVETAQGDIKAMKIVTGGDELRILDLWYFLFLGIKIGRRQQLGDALERLL